MPNNLPEQGFSMRRYGRCRPALLRWVHSLRVSFFMLPGSKLTFRFINSLIFYDEAGQYERWVSFHDRARQRQADISGSRNGILRHSSSYIRSSSPIPQIIGQIRHRSIYSLYPSDSLNAPGSSFTCRVKTVRERGRR